MTYNSDLRWLNMEFHKFFQNNLEPKEEELKEWIKLAYQKGRIAMGDDDYEQE